MRITVAQIFQIGSVLITLASVLVGLYWDPKITSVVSAAVLTAWNAVGAILTTPNAQANAVAAHLDTDANLKTTVVQAVANLPGVEHIQLNTRADGALAQLGASAESVNSKISSPR